MKLIDIHKNYIKESARSIVDSNLPIKAKIPVTPIMAIEKWRSTDDGGVIKKFIFESYEDRNRFMISLLNYELEKGHHAKMLIDELNVTIKLITKDVEKLTELDKSYSKYADVIRRDIAYNAVHER